MTGNLGYIITYLDFKEPKVHKTYSIENGFCYLSDAKGNRYRIDDHTKLDEVIKLINQIKKV